MKFMHSINLHRNRIVLSICHILLFTIILFSIIILFAVLLLENSVYCIVNFPQPTRPIIPILCCEDRLLRVMTPESEVLYSVEVPATPSTVHLFYEDGGEYGDLLMYGTTDGRLGLLAIGRRVGF